MGGTADTETVDRTDDRDGSPAFVPEAVREHESLPAAVLLAMGLSLAVIVTHNLFTELSALPTRWPPIVAAIQGYGPAAVLVYAAARLERSEFEAAGRWRLSGGAVLGVAVFGGTYLLTLVIRFAEGRPVGEPVYAAFATAGAGSLAGLFVGLLYARSRRDARQARRTRDRFELLNSILRHDVLNKMMIIRSRAEFLTEKTSGDDRAFADTIVTQSDAIADQIERTRAILDALSEGGTSVEPVALEPAVDAAVDPLRTTHEDLELSVDVPRVEVVADDLLEDVIGNVLTNAVDHNDEPVPWVAVTVEAADDHVDLRVADNGPGVSDDRKEAIFRRDATGLHEDGTGSGFGLFFVDAMLENYGGDVWVEDNEPSGAVFVLRFRRPAVDEPDGDG